MPRLPSSLPANGLLISVLAVVLAGCGAPATSLTPIGSGIAVPAEELRPVDRCMFEAGFRATEVHQGRVGSNAVYSWATTTWYTWEAAGANATAVAMANCRDRFAPFQEKTVDELRKIYNRWVLERQCLMALGFSPQSPPSSEEFRATWRAGPWMPIDGIDFRSLTGEAKERCGLEMVD
jgi:hypothetical protein